ncbi:MAG: class I SAM-dependent methyltransferase [Bacteroidia bacterium]|nr:class I SAM-dependent methyltransferase [Bacteroidia bacterium]
MKKYNTLLEAGTGSGVFYSATGKTLQQHFMPAIYTAIFSHIPELCKHYGIADCNVSTQSIESTSYSNEQFDAVVAVSVLEFVPDVQKL